MFWLGQYLKRKIVLHFSKFYVRHFKGFQLILWLTDHAAWLYLADWGIAFNTGRNCTGKFSNGHTAEILCTIGRGLLICRALLSVGSFATCSLTVRVCSMSQNKFCPGNTRQRETQCFQSMTG